MQRCTGCRGVLLAKSDVRALSQVDPGRHEVLRASAEELVTRSTKVLRCPRCAKPMLSYAFGGGNTRAEGCETCGLAFFDGGELARALEEMRSGIAMSEETRTALHAHRAMSTWDRVGRAEVAMIAALGLGLVTFVVLTRRGRTSLLVAGVIAFAVYVFYRWKAERSKIAASKQLDQLIANEAALVARSARRSAPPAPTSKPTRPCPFCAAKLPVGTTHCNACDSDFG